MSTAILPPPPPTASQPPIAATATTAGQPQPAQTGVWIAIATISMSFAALTSALIVRQSGAADWQHFRLPPLLYLNTFVLLASSVSLERSRRQRSALGLHAALALGLLFIAGQALAWRQLGAQGLFLATGPSSAFFYVFTVLHALHVLGGLGGLLYVRRRLIAGRLAPSTFAAAALYWHFMAILWLYLLLLLTIRA